MDDAMQTLRQIVEVGDDRKLEIILPATVEPGPLEIVVTFQPAQSPEPSPLNKFKSLFGFLKKRLNSFDSVDPVAFQRELRNEWDR